MGLVVFVGYYAGNDLSVKASITSPGVESTIGVLQRACDYVLQLAPVLFGKVQKPFTPRVHWCACAGIGQLARKALRQFFP